MPEIPLATRLKLYGINPADIQLPDLNVAQDSIVTLATDDKALSKQSATLSPQSIDDVKKWMGVPDSVLTTVPHTAITAADTAAARSNLRPVLHPVVQAVLPVHPSYTPTEDLALRSLASSYVFGRTDTVSADQLPALNNWIKVIVAHIPIVFFNNITVASGATLVVQHTILFAHYITVNKGGKIQMKATKSNINCAGFKGL